MDIGCCLEFRTWIWSLHASPLLQISDRHLLQVLKSGLAHAGWLQSMHLTFWLFRKWLRAAAANELRGRSPQMSHSTGRHARHWTDFNSISAVGSRLGCTGTSSLPHVPGESHFTSRHVRQVVHDGLVHAGLLQLRHNIARSVFAALWMSLSEKAPFGNSPHLLHLNVSSA